MQAYKRSSNSRSKQRPWGLAMDPAKVIAGAGLTFCIACSSHAQSAAQSIANSVCESQSTIYRARTQELQACLSETSRLGAELGQTKAQAAQLKADLEASQRAFQTLKDSNPGFSVSTMPSGTDCLAQVKTALLSLGFTVEATTSGQPYGHLPGCTVLAICGSLAETRSVTSYTSCIPGKDVKALSASVVEQLKAATN